jgi:hypothetical protein
MLAYGAMALTAHWLARHRADPLLTYGVGASAVSATLAVAIPLSAGMEWLDPVGIVLAALVAVAALRIADTPRLLASRWSMSAAGMALLLGLPSLAWALPNTPGYIASGWIDVTVPRGDVLRWWLPMLVAHVVAAVIGLTALVRRSPARASVAIPLVMGAVARQTATYEPESWQAYAVVLAIALFATGLAWHRAHWVSDPLYALGSAVPIGAPFTESFTIGGTTDAFIAGGYGILVVMLGLILRRQEPVATGAIGVTLVVLR